jgi:hypothetical protein
MPTIDTSAVYTKDGKAAYPLQKEEEETRNEQPEQQVKAKGNQPERFLKLQTEARRLCDVIQDTCPDVPGRDVVVNSVISLVCDAYKLIEDSEPGSNIR